MTEVQVQLKIDAPAERVWDVLVDANIVPEWLTTKAQPGAGDSANEEAETSESYNYDLFSTLSERALDWDAGRSYSYIVENFGPIKSAYSSFYASPTEDGTLLTQTINFEMKYGPLGSVLDNMVFRPQFQKQMTNSLKSLKEFVEGTTPMVEAEELSLAA